MNSLSAFALDFFAFDFVSYIYILIHIYFKKPHKTGLLPSVRDTCKTQPWGVCPRRVLSAGSGQQRFQAGIDFTDFSEGKRISTDPCLRRSRSQSKHRRHATSPTRRAKEVAERWNAAGLVRRRLLASRGNGSMLLVSTTDVTCPGQKYPCNPIKMEKLLLKRRGQRDVETPGFKRSFMRRVGVHSACKTAER